MTKRAVAPLEQESARTALDELFALARKYNSSDAYLELMRFVAKFRFYSPFNAMLIYTQMPGAHFPVPLLAQAFTARANSAASEKIVCPTSSKPALRRRGHEKGPIPVEQPSLRIAA
jgi:hypothetical protein